MFSRYEGLVNNQESILIQQVRLNMLSELHIPGMGDIDPVVTYCKGCAKNRFQWAVYLIGKYAEQEIQAIYGFLSGSRYTHFDEISKKCVQIGDDPELKNKPCSLHVSALRTAPIESAKRYIPEAAFSIALNGFCELLSR